MLFSRYNSGYHEILEMDFLEALELVNYAEKQKGEELLLFRWITNHEKQMSYNAFKEKLGIRVNPNNVQEKSVEGILLNLKEVFG